MWSLCISAEPKKKVVEQRKKQHGQPIRMVAERRVARRTNESFMIPNPILIVMVGIKNEIENNSFYGLEQLDNLLLGSNKINILRPGSFFGLNRLDQLNLEKQDKRRNLRFFYSDRSYSMERVVVLLNFPSSLGFSNGILHTFRSLIGIKNDSPL